MRCSLASLWWRRRSNDPLRCDKYLGDAVFVICLPLPPPWIPVGKQRRDHIQRWINGTLSRIPSATSDSFPPLPDRGSGCRRRQSRRHEGLASRQVNFHTVGIHRARHIYHRDRRGRNRDNQRIGTDTALFRAQGGITRQRVGPAGTDIAFFRRLPAVAAAAHPVVCVTQLQQRRYRVVKRFPSRDPLFFRREVADCLMCVPLFHWRPRITLWSERLRIISPFSSCWIKRESSSPRANKRARLVSIGKYGSTFFGNVFTHVAG